MSSKPTIAILGDGYQTSAEFHAQATRVRDAILADPAFRGRVEVVPVFRASTRDGLPTQPDDSTAFGSYILRNGSGRWGGGVANGPALRAASSAANASWTVLLWNTTAPYGANLSTMGVAIVAGDRNDAGQVTLHELGHAVGGLADEYRVGSAFPAPAGELDAPNLSIHADGRKWNTVLGLHAENGNPVDAFEGAGLYPHGVYRPCANTRMRDHRQPFSPVDMLAIRGAIDGAAGRIPGDANGDGEVNFADLNMVLSEFGQRGDNLDGDVNRDGRVGFDDLNQVRSNFGASTDEQRTPRGV
jgi:hypothetical protein